MKTITFIGVGNMASAIIGGMLASGYKPELITVFDKMSDKAEVFIKKGVKLATSLADACEASELILLAVKPQNFKEVLTEIKTTVPDIKNKTFISIAAGISTEAIENMLGEKLSVIRVMPNTPLQIGMGTSALSKNERVSDEDFAIACDIFESAGMVMVIDESQMNTVICVNGSSPAYFYYFIDAMVRSAKAQGLTLDDRTILEAACKTVIGSAEMLLRSGKTADELVKAVTSPRGTTEQAMNVFRDRGLADTVDAAMRACTERAEEMALEFGK